MLLKRKSLRQRNTKIYSVIYNKQNMKADFLKEPQLIFLREGNYLEGDETPEQRFDDILKVVQRYEHLYSDGLAHRLDYIFKKNIYSLSTPSLANFGRKPKEGANTVPLPVSCNIITVGDSISEIYGSIAETAMLSKLGAGVGLDFTSVAQKGTMLSEGFFTNPKMDWIEASIDTAQKVSQSNKRRGYAVPFVSIEDDEFEEVLARVDKANPDKNDVMITNTVGIILPRGFRDKIRSGDKEARRRWIKLLEARQKAGNVYIVDIENMNKNISPVYEKLGLEVTSTNICTEVVTPKFDDKTFACVIGSLNLKHWDEIKNNLQIIKDCFMFLDIVNEEYIRLTEGVPFLEKARRSAIEKRDIGLGTLGFHELLQMKGYAFGDMYSRKLNKEIYSTMREVGEGVTREMAEKLGSPKMCKDAGLVRRNVSLMMIAPNKSTSFISEATSLGIEPFMTNIFEKEIANIEYSFKNKNLELLLESLGQNTSEVWESIAKNLGSVQHLDFLSDHDKSVFKTFAEISPKDILDLAADRQEYIDMAQSLNLVIRPNYTMKDLINIHMYAFDKGIKTLYYLYPQAHAALEKDGMPWDACEACAD